MTTTSVLIVGGSLNGLSAFLLLAHRQVGCVAVERPDKQQKPAILLFSTIVDL